MTQSEPRWDSPLGQLSALQSVLQSVLQLEMPSATVWERSWDSL